MNDVVTVLRNNRVAVIVLASGTILVAVLISDRLTKSVGGAVETVEQTVRDLTAKILSSGFVAAAILIAASLLGAPVWLAFAATGLYLSVSAVGKGFGALVASSTGTGTGSATGAREFTELLCDSHGGAQSELEAGGTVLLSCRDGTVFRLKAAGE